MPWQYKPASNASGAFSLVIDADVIYSGCDSYAFMTEFSTGQTYAHYISSYGNGVDNRVNMAVAGASPRVAVAGYQGVVIAYEAKGMQGGMNKVWSNSLKGTGDDVVHVTGDTGYVYAGTNGYVRKLDAASGQITASNDLPDRGNHEVTLVLWNGLLVAGTNGWLVGMDAVSLATRWQLSLPKAGYDVVALDTNTDYIFAASAGYLYCVDANGNIQDTNSLKGTGSASPTLSVNNSKVLVGCAKKLFYFNEVDGIFEHEWTESIPNSGANTPGNRVDVFAGNHYAVAARSGFVFGLDYSPNANPRIARKEPLKGLGNYPVAFEMVGNEVIMGINGTLAVSPLSLAAFPAQYQFETNWCWLACAASVSSYYQSSSGLYTQCSLADKLLGQNFCCIVGSAPSCNKPGYVSQALHETGNYAGGIEYALGLEQLSMQIGLGRPVVADVFASQNVGHSVVITGLHPDQTIDVVDPTSGFSTLLYTEFLYHYLGGYEWGRTVYTED